jgi:hypothetical protein
MRKKLPAALLLAALLLTSCGGKGTTAPADSAPQASAKAETAASAAQSKAAAQAEAGGSMAAVATQSAAAPLSEEEVLSAYQRAEEAYGWFDLATMPTAPETATVDGVLYQRVDYPGITSLDDLRTYLRDLFSDAIVDRLLPEEQKPPIYCDVGGVLYALPTGRGADIYKGKCTMSVEQVSATRYLVNVAVETLGDDLQTVTGVECSAFPYDLTDGHWVFTDFRLVY